MEREREAALALAAVLKTKWEAERGFIESKNPLDVQSIGKVFYGIGSKIADVISPSSSKTLTPPAETTAAFNTSNVEATTIASKADSSPKQQRSKQQQIVVRPSVVVEELIPGRPRGLEESSS